MTFPSQGAQPTFPPKSTFPPKKPKPAFKARGTEPLKPNVKKAGRQQAIQQLIANRADPQSNTPVKPVS